MARGRKPRRPAVRRPAHHRAEKGGEANSGPGTRLRRAIAGEKRLLPTQPGRTTASAAAAAPHARRRRRARRCGRRRRNARACVRSAGREEAGASSRRTTAAGDGRRARLIGCEPRRGAPSPRRQQPARRARRPDGGDLPSAVTASRAITAAARRAARGAIGTRLRAMPRPPARPRRRRQSSGRGERPSSTGCRRRAPVGEADHRAAEGAVKPIQAASPPASRARIRPSASRSGCWQDPAGTGRAPPFGEGRIVQPAAPLDEFARK